MSLETLAETVQVQPETDLDSVNDQWGRVCVQLKKEVGEAAFKSWLKPMSVGGQSGSQLKLCVPTRFMRDWVVSHYAERIRVLFQIENPDIEQIEYLVQPSRPGLRTNGGANGAPIARKPGLVGHAAAPSRAAPPQGGRVSLDTGRDSDSVSAPLDPRFTFDNFVVGKPNEFAYAAARRVADSDAPPFNPLFLYSGVGLGKTHLMHSIAWHVSSRDPRRTVIYLSAEKFMYRFIRALRYQDTMAFKEQFRSVDVLMIDDVQFISGKDSTQEEFFHTFNALVDQGKQVIISADQPPSELEGVEERLKSRLGSGLVADIHPTNYELRLAILQSKAMLMDVDIPWKVMEFLAHRISASVRELEGALRRVVAHAQLMGRPITLETTQEVLHDLLRSCDKRVTIEEIQKKVASHFNIRMTDMSSARRARAVARPRQVAMYLTKQLTSRSLPDIGSKFGGRDHTTVMHAVRKVEELCQTDSGFREEVELLRRMLEG